MRISDWSSDVCSSDLLAATGVCGARRSPATASLPDAPGTGKSCGRAGCAAPGELLGLPALELPALELGAAGTAAGTPDGGTEPVPGRPGAGRPPVAEIGRAHV